MCLESSRKGKGKRKKTALVSDSMWSHMHQLIDPDDCDAEIDPECRPCNSAGVCICCHGGMRLHTLRNNFIGGLKMAFDRTDRELKSLLVNGHAFVKITLHPMASSPAESEELAAFWGLVPQWVHVSDLMLSPYDSYLQPMEDVSNIEFDCELSARVGDEIALKAYGVENAPPAALVVCFRNMRFWLLVL